MREDINKLRREASELVNRCQSLQLATVNQDGAPLASYAPFYRSDDGDYYVFVSILSAHTANLVSGTASILLIEDEERSPQIYARKRLGFACNCARISSDANDYPVILERLEERHGTVIQTLRTLADFRLYRLRPTSGSFVIGFGQAYAVSPNLQEFEHVQPGR